MTVVVELISVPGIEHEVLRLEITGQKHKSMSEVLKTVDEMTGIDFISNEYDYRFTINKNSIELPEFDDVIVGDSNTITITPKHPGV